MLPRILRQKEILQSLIAYLAAPLVCSILVFGILKGWQADLSVPLSYTGDALFVQSWVKGLIDNGWYLDNDHLGAPEGSHLQDYPIADNLHFGCMKLIALAVPQFGAVCNLYYFLTYPLTAFLAFLVLRRFQVGRMSALVGAVLYALLPYHFMRGQGHFFLACYYLVPLTIMVILWVWQDDRAIFFRGHASLAVSGWKPNLRVWPGLESSEAPAEGATSPVVSGWKPNLQARPGLESSEAPAQGATSLTVPPGLAEVSSTGQMRPGQGGGQIPRGFSPWSWRALASVLICLLTASAGIYYAFFACYLLIAAGIAGCLAHRKKDPLLNAGILAAIVFVGGLANLLPTFLYRAENGKNPVLPERIPVHVEAFSLKIAQLVLPITGHRLPWLAHLKEKYNQANVLPIGEGDTSTLGIVASVGFLFLLAGLLLIRRKGTRPTVYEGLVLLNLFALLLATVGGFDSLVGIFISPAIRAYNRISVYIAFFSLFALVLMLDKLGSSWSRGKWRVSFYGLCCLFLLMGVLDQTSRYFAPDYASVRAQYLNDDAFALRVEQEVPANAMVFQLPFAEYPEGLPCIHGMQIYDHFRPYLHSRTIRWSYGAMKGRAGNDWQKAVAELPVPAMVQELAKAGFAGIYVDRAGFPDKGVAIETALTSLVGPPVVISPDGHQSFFRIGTGGYTPAPSFAQRQENHSAPEAAQ